MKIPGGVGEDEIVDCETCGAELTVESLEPPRVVLFREEEK
jgi:lysine biosynthesis protein LysW